MVLTAGLMQPPSAAGSAETGWSTTAVRPVPRPRSRERGLPAEGTLRSAVIAPTRPQRRRPRAPSSVPRRSSGTGVRLPGRGTSPATARRSGQVSSTWRFVPSLEDGRGQPRGRRFPGRDERRAALCDRGARPRPSMDPRVSDRRAHGVRVPPGTAAGGCGPGSPVAPRGSGGHITTTRIRADRTSIITGRRGGRVGPQAPTTPSARRPTTDDRPSQRPHEPGCGPIERHKRPADRAARDAIDRTADNAAEGAFTSPCARPHPPAR